MSRRHFRFCPASFAHGSRDICVFTFIGGAALQRGRGRERRRGRERLGKRRTGTKTHDGGYRLHQSDQSIGLTLLQHACGFFCLLPLLPQSFSSSSSFSSSTSLLSLTYQRRGRIFTTCRIAQERVLEVQREAKA